MSLARVFVLGNAGLDLRIELPRLPRPGETLLGANPSRAPGGKGLNQAAVASRAGAATHLLAPLGDDAVGTEIAQAIATEGFAGLELPRMAAPTDYSVLMVLPGGENSITGAGPCAAALAADAAWNFAGRAGEGDLVLLQGNLTRAATEAALHAARARGARTMLNPAPLWWEMRAVLGLCDIVVANRGEAGALTDASTPEDAARQLRAGAGQAAIVTLGAEGCILAASDAIRQFPAIPVRAIDSTGCGDAFCGSLAAALARGAGLAAAIGLAQRAAAITATRPGAFAALPTSAELAA